MNDTKNEISIRAFGDRLRLRRCFEPSALASAHGTFWHLNHLATISCYHPLLSTMYTSVNEVFFSNEAFSTNQLFSLNELISYNEVFSCK